MLHRVQSPQQYGYAVMGQVSDTRCCTSPRGPAQHLVMTNVNTDNHTTRSMQTPVIQSNSLGATTMLVL